jgi:hypothetical protein
MAWRLSLPISGAGPILTNLACGNFYDRSTIGQ